MTAGSRRTKPKRSTARNEERVREETRREERAHAKEEAAEAERARGHLQHLFEISKLLTRFDSVERTVPEILAVLSAAIPLRVAVLMLEERGARNRTRAIVWHAEGVSAAWLRAARARAKIAYDYLVRATEGSPLEDETGPTRLPSAAPAAPDEGTTTGFVLLPLVVEHCPIFGGLQVEGAARLDEADLAFVNAAVNQLAIALDRVAVIRANQAEAEARRVAAESAAAEAERSERSQRLLSETSALLAGSLDYHETLTAVVRAAVPFVADLAFVDQLAEKGQVQRLAIAVADPNKQYLAERLEQFAPASGIAHDEAHAQLLKEIGVSSMMSVPLVARGRTLGVLTFAAAESGRRYSAPDFALAAEIGRRAALAIDNARLYEQAQRAIQARQDLLAIVSHDLKNPLGTILMSTALLLREYAAAEPGSSGRRCIDRIQRSAEAMRRLIGDLLDSASIEAGHLTLERKRHSVTPLVQEAVDLHEPLAAQRKLRLQRPLRGEPFHVNCDRERVLQVFGNLIGNAIKFTPEGGTIEIRAEQHGEEALFSVTDTGPGIPPDELPHIFDRYWQARETARLGTGLGLSIAQGVVEAHGGRIWAESKLGQGTTFFFTIPMIDADPARPRQRHRTRDASIVSSAPSIGAAGERLDLVDRSPRQEPQRFMSDATAFLTSSLDYHTMLERVAHVVVPDMADWCLVDLVSSDGTIHQTAAAHVDPDKEELARGLGRRLKEQPELSHGVVYVRRTGKSEMYPEVTDMSWAADALGVEHPELLRELGARSYMCVPLVARGSVLGVISFGRALPARRYSTADLTLAEELGRRAGMAVDNARLYADAQEAIRARDEFLCVASHELKTLLTPLQLGLDLLVRVVRETGADPILKGRLETASRQAQRIAKLVENLLDVLGLVNGSARSALRLEEFDLTEMVRDVLGRFRADAEASGCELTFHAEGPLEGRWDRFRLEQFLANLLSNAIMFGAGKPIAVTVSKSETMVRLSVEDHGIRLSRDESERTFPKFERALPMRHFGGLGLGLFMTRQIARAHGGTLVVQSEPGDGATFTGVLPLQCDVALDDARAEGGGIERGQEHPGR